jgi:serine/threonine protein kinase
VANTGLNQMDIVSSIQPGQILAGRYQILAHLGTGGMSALYQARDLLADQTIAIKIVLPFVSRDPRLRDKFRQEVIVARRLTHPNVIRIYDIGEHQGLLFISMELIEGQTVADLLARRKRFSVEQFLPFFNQFTSALAYIHSQQVLHRDIKPQNLMYDKDGTLKVMDFGIARVMASSQSTHTRMGTPPYMSPELLKGAPLTPASDIYSAGIMFYELLTGARLFRKGSLHERMNKRVPRVSKFVRDIPSVLDEMVDRCLQFRPEDRFQSVQELISFVSERCEQRLAPSGMLSDLIQNDPPAPVDVLPVLVGTVRRLAAIHKDPTLRPVLTPNTIRWSENGVEIKTMPATEAHHTVAVDCKYPSFLEFDAAAVAQRGESDVYVLGFIFYEVLLGQALFRTQFSDIYNGDPDLQWLNWHSDPTATVKPLREILTNCPSALSDIIQNMLQKGAKGRPDLGRVERELSSVLEQLRQKDTGRAATPQVRPPSRARRKRLFGRTKTLIKNAAVVSLAVAAGAAVLGGGSWLLWKLWQSASSPPAAESPVAVSVRPVSEPAPPEPVLPKTIDSGTGLMMLIPATAKVPSFYIDKYEVTNRLYKEFCDATRRNYPSAPAWDSHYFEKPDYPVINVSWYDARAYADWAGKRLPAQGEWELAGRGPNGNMFPWGNEFQENAANLAGAADGYEHTAPVGSFTLDVSPFGVMDMAGNVSEWLQDQAIRGGDVADDPQYARLTNTSSRSKVAAGHSPATGFRCAADAQTIINVLVKQSK